MYCLLSKDSSLANLHSDLCLHFHPKAASRLSVHCRSGLGPPTSGTQLVLSRRVSVPQRWFTPQEKALDERILLNPVTSYSDKNYADNVAKTTDDAPAARSSCVPVLQWRKSLVPIQQCPHHFLLLWVTYQAPSCSTTLVAVQSKLQEGLAKLEAAHSASAAGFLLMC